MADAVAVTAVVGVGSNHPTKGMRMKIGDMQIDTLIDGEVAVPTEMAYPPSCNWAPHQEYLDDFSGLMLNTVGSQLIRYDDRLVLVDAGNGPNSPYPFVGGALRSALYNAGLSAFDITDVIFTHLHLDHVGWASVNGKPYFANATYHIDRRDWDHFIRPDYERPEWEAALQTESAYDKLNPVADQVEFFEGDDQVLPGIEAIEASGHTPGSTVFKLTSGGEEGMLIGDLVHTIPELINDRWDFLAHNHGEQAMDSVEKIRQILVDTKVPFAAAHFPGMPWAQLSSDGNGGFTYTKIG